MTLECGAPPLAPDATISVRPGRRDEPGRRTGRMPDDQRAALTPPDEVGSPPAPASPAAPIDVAATLAVPWTMRQALTGGALTLVPLISLQAWAALTLPRAATATTRLTPRQDWSAAIVIVLSQLLVE